MYLWYMNLHLIAGISWIFFLISFIRDRKAIFNLLSLIFMLIVIFLGVKLITLNPSILKSGGWLHAKLSLIVILMFENLYLSILYFKKKEISKILLETFYWMDYIILITIFGLGFFRPF